MKELAIEINEAYKLLAAIPVMGDNVEVMASVRERLRRAYNMAVEHAETGHAEKGEESNG